MSEKNSEVFLNIKESPIYSSKPESEIKESWKNDFTNPNNHNNDKYCYIVHGLIGPEARIKQKIFLSDIKTSDNSQDIDLLQYPEKVSERKILSASIIDQNHKTTWGSAGLILDVSYENVIAAYREDVSTPFFDIEHVKKEKVPTIDDVLKLTDPDLHNEIVLNGSVEDKKINVSGFWAKIDKEGQPVNKFLYRRIRRLAENKGLPLIKINEEKEIDTLF